MSKNISIKTCFVGLFVYGVSLLSCAGAGVSSAGIGPQAIQPFGLERPEMTKETETAKLTNPFKNFRMPEGVLRPATDGRVQLFSIARLTEQDLANPFEIRVEVIVDMKETVFEIGGIIEGTTDSKNTVILLTRSPYIRKAGQDTAAANSNQQKAEQEQVPKVYSVGDTVEGFKICAIGRQSILLEQSEKFVEVTRGHPVTVCVPLSAITQ